MQKILSTFSDDFGRKCRNSVMGYPVEIGLGIFIAFFFGFALDSSTGADHFVRFFFPTVLVWLAVFAISCLYGLGALNRNARVGLTAGVVAVGAAYAFWFFDIDLMAHFWRWFLLVTALVCTVMVVPLMAKDKSVPREVRFWRFNTRLITRFAVCGFYVSALYVGLVLALGATSALLGWWPEPEFYGRLGAWLFAGLGPWMFVAGVGEALDLDRPVPQASIRWIARLGSFLMMPLLCIYLLITYGYGLRITLTDFAPSNVISPLILGAGMLGFLGLYLVEPLRHREDYALLSRIFQFFPVALLLILPASVWAIAMRIEQYGWTEFRYVRLLAVLCFAILCIYGGVQLLRRRAMALSSIPVVVAVAFFLAAMGPWSATNVSKKSQLDRLENIALTAGVLTADRKIDPGTISSMSSTERRELAQVVRYVRQTHGVQALSYIAPRDQDDMDAFARSLGSNRSLKYRAYEPAMDSPPVQVRLENQDIVVTRTGPLFSFSRLYPDSRELSFSSGNDKSFRVNLEKEMLTVGSDSKIWRADVSKLVATVTPDPSERLIPNEHTNISLLDKDNNIVGELIVTQIFVDFSNDHPSLQWVSGHIIIDEEVP